MFNKKRLNTFIKSDDNNIFQEKNENESISVTMCFFFALFPDPAWPFIKWTFQKCPKSISERQT
jgi:hypothetical protein